MIKITQAIKLDSSEKIELISCIDHNLNNLFLFI